MKAKLQIDLNLARALCVAMFCQDASDCRLAGRALADFLEEHDLGSETTREDLRGNNFSPWRELGFATVVEALAALRLRQGRSLISSLVRQAVKESAVKLYESRSTRSSHPEGTFDRQGRWYPSERENVHRDVTAGIRSPSANFPYSYMLRARTKQHCTCLAHAALYGHDLPPDAASTFCGLRERVLALILESR